MPLDFTSTDEETIIDERTGLKIVPNRDALKSDFSRTLHKDFYLRNGETPQLGYARASLAWSGGDLALAQRLYDAVSKGWFMFASPVLSNAPLPGEKVRAMPISCFLSYVPDTVEGLIDHSSEIKLLSISGGGVGSHFRDVRAVSKKAPGPIPFIVSTNYEIEAYKQPSRRGSDAVYMDISHPDVAEFVQIRIPVGDMNRKCQGIGFHHGINITDAFMTAVVENTKWNLVDPYDGQTKETVNARALWEVILETRYRTGEPYLYFIDTAQKALPQTQRDLGLRTHGSNLCSEITLPTNEERTAVCCLSSLNAEKYDEWKDTSLVSDLIVMLDNIISYYVENASSKLAKTIFSASQERSLGLGVMGFHAYLQKHMVPFESKNARKINKEMFSYINHEAVQSSLRLGSERGEAPDMKGTGRRNAHLLAIAPNGNSSILLETSPSIEPFSANAYNHQTRAGSWLVKNHHLEALLETKNMNNDDVWTDIITNKGSVQHLDFLSDDEKYVFKTAIELDQMWLVTHASDRQPFICQSQSLNLFFPSNANRKYINKVHISAWKKGLKSLYYTRTMSPSMVQSVSKKVERIALKDGSAVINGLIDSVDMPIEIANKIKQAAFDVIAESEAECVSCQG